jgi:hypothetical protein
MKKILIAMTLFFALTANAFAGEDEVKKEVLDAFNATFTTARDVTWIAGNKHYKAAFQYYGMQMFAYYSTSGKLIGVTRHMSSTELPLFLLHSLKENYSNYWITNVVEESNKNGFSFYITLEDAQTRIILKSKHGSAWTVYSEQQKL